MGRWFNIIGLIILLSLVISACSSATPTEISGEPVQVETTKVEEQFASATPAGDSDSMMGEATQTSEAIEAVTPRASATPEPTKEVITETAEPTEELPEPEATPDEVELPAWFQSGVTDVRTGERFKIGDHLGKVILIETMAVWCPNCKTQAEQIQELHELLGHPESMISISLDVDPFEDAEILSNFQEKNGFDWPFAIASIKIAQEISKEYGEGYLNPVSTPILLVDPQGKVHPLRLGAKNAEYLLEVVKPLLPEGT